MSINNLLLNLTSNRLTLLKENLRLDHLNGEEKLQLLDICTEYNDIFFLPDDNLTCTKAIQHEIIVTDPSPISSKIYRFPEVHKQEVDKEVKKKC